MSKGCRSCWDEADGLPQQLPFEEVGSATLTVKLLVYGYSAFTLDRYQSGCRASRAPV